MVMKFQKLEVWQLSYELSRSIYIGIKEIRDFGFKDQITLSGLSVPSNIADKNAGAIFEQFVVWIGLVKVVYMDVQSKE